VKTTRCISRNLRHPPIPAPSPPACQYPRAPSQPAPSEQAAEGSGLLSALQLSLHTECAYPPPPNKPSLPAPLPTSSSIQLPRPITSIALIFALLALLALYFLPRPSPPSRPHFSLAASQPRLFDLGWLWARAHHPCRGESADASISTP
jgi:hypothetical protein